jgi:hypothetical protein
VVAREQAHNARNPDTPICECPDDEVEGNPCLEHPNASRPASVRVREVAGDHVANLCGESSVPARRTRMRVDLTDREIATMLASLRNWQIDGLNKASDGKRPGGSDPGQMLPHGRNLPDSRRVRWSKEGPNGPFAMNRYDYEPGRQAELLIGTRANL